MTQVPSPGAKNLTTLTGQELVALLAGSVSAQATAAKIAALAASSVPFTSTSISTAGNGTLTAAGLLGSQIVRTGPTGDYSDATDTAAAIIAAFPSATVGQAHTILIKNATAFTQTITAGVGVTLPTTIIIPAWSEITYVVQVTSATTVSFTHLGSTPISTGTTLSAPALTALNTVGAGTILATAVNNGNVMRTGTQVAAFTDTTDTAAAIIGACANLIGKIGSSFVFCYENATAFPATITGGTGVTVSGLTIVPAGSWAQFLVTYTAAATITMVGYEAGPLVTLPFSQVTTGSAATFPAGAITGANFTNYINTGSNAALTTRTAAQMFGDIPNCVVGFTYQLAIRNTNATGATVTAADGSVTLSGTMTIAQNVTRLFSVQFTAANAVTITSMGISAAGA